MALKKFRPTRPVTSDGAGQPQRRQGPARTRGRDRSRPRGSTRPTLRQQLEAPIEPRHRADPGTVRRALAIGALLTLMLVVLTPTLRSYLQQRTEIQQLKEQKVRGEADVAALQAQKKQWLDPAYVKKQAETRLGFAMPGQRQITVYVDDNNQAHQVRQTTGVANATALSNHPWYGQLWGSVTMSSQSETQTDPASSTSKTAK